MNALKWTAAVLQVGLIFAAIVLAIYGDVLPVLFLATCSVTNFMVDLSTDKFRAIR